MRALLATLLVCAPLLGALPAADAQNVPQPSLRLTLVDPARAFEPGTSGTLDLYGIYGVPPGSPGDPNAEILERGNESRPTRVTFSVVQMPSWVTDAVVEPAETYVDLDQGEYLKGGDKAFGGIVVRINVSPDAPALQREEIVVEGIAHPNGRIPEARGLTPAIKLRAAEVGKVNVTGPESPIVFSGGRWNVVTYTVTNEGNMDTTILLNVTVRPERSEVEYPQEVQLAVGESTQVDVRVRTPWTEREEGTLELKATPLLTDDEGPSASHAVDVRGESAVPGPGVAPLLALGVVVAVAARRRQRS